MINFCYTMLESTISFYVTEYIKSSTVKIFVNIRNKK